ncbi:MAG: ABC transporter permease, partial [Oscillospiraceae bacterium]|nr:ABC transporter permease [Oscillospiraceae bacterium]
MTVWSLHKIESAPKSKLRHGFDRAVTVLPILFIALLIAQYKLVPNFEKYAANPLAFPITDTLTALAAVFGVALIAYFIVSLFNEKIYEKLLSKSPLYCVVTLLFIVYDHATLKTGSLPLPYFPWVDRVLSAIVDDRAMLLDCTKNSLILLFTGYVVGVAAGLITGIGAGWSGAFRYWVSPLIKVLGPIPSTTWMPIILI